MSLRLLRCTAERVAASLPAAANVAERRVCRIRETDNLQNLQSVKARRKFSSERLWHCQAELEKN